MYKLHLEVTEPHQFRKLYYKRFRCTFYVGVIFEIGAATLEIAVPWLTGLYFYHPEIKEDYYTKKSLKYILYFLLFFISFCAWVRGYMVTRATENMAKEMRYDIYYNYIVHLEKERVMQ